MRNEGKKKGFTTRTRAREHEVRNTSLRNTGLAIPGIGAPTSRHPGLTRGSMDCRVKPGNDEGGKPKTLDRRRE